MNKVKPAQLHEYPEYLPSGETRIRAIPEQWDVSKLKHFLKVNESTLPETTDPDAEFRYIEIGAVESGDLTEPPRKIQFGTAPSRARRMVKPGDTIVSTVRTYLKAVWYADDPGDDLICSTGFAVLTPREGTIPKFASYVALSAPFTDQVTAESVGIAYPAISEKKLSDLTIMVPPPEEQANIVRFLDHTNEQIRRYIAAKERLIKLLEEERQALVHEAVTRGLDPNVRLKESRVEWLGEIPEHWETARLRSIGRFSKGNGGTKEDEVPAGVPCIRYGDIYTSHKYFIKASRAYIKPEKTSEYTPLRFGDILFAGSGETVEEIGKSAVNLIEEPAYSGGDVIILRPTVEINAEFTGYTTDSPAA